MKTLAKVAAYGGAAAVVITAALLTSYSTTYFIMDKAPQENTQRVLSTVEAVCNYAHHQTSGETEEECGRAQDASNTEYLCNHDGTQCWAEDKQ